VSYGLPFDLFSRSTLAGMVDAREAAARADPSRDTDDLIRRYVLDVPMLTGAPRIIERRLTEPFVDRYHEEVPGGELLFVAAYDFSGDPELFGVRPKDGKPPSGYASVAAGALVIQHLEGHTTIAIAPEDLARTLSRPRPDPVVADAAENERLMLGVATAMAGRISQALDQLRIEAVPVNAELAARIRAIVGLR
jgi:hypothetical protein